MNDPPRRFQLGEESRVRFTTLNRHMCPDCGTSDIKLNQFEAVCMNKHCWGYVDCDIWRKRQDKN